MPPLDPSVPRWRPSEAGPLGWAPLVSPATETPARVTRVADRDPEQANRGIEYARQRKYPVQYDIQRPRGIRFHRRYALFSELDAKNERVSCRIRNERYEITESQVRLRIRCSIGDTNVTSGLLVRKTPRKRAQRSSC